MPLKVISGSLKGRNILGYNIQGTRPTMDRVKESVFAMIQDNIQNSICLDLFAGSGNFGIEAISNGSKYTYFVDNNKECYLTILKNLNNYKVNNYKVLQMDYMTSLKYFCDNKISFDLIFIDPPYNMKIIDKILNYINQNNLLNKNGQVVCEYQNDILKEEYGNIKLLKTKKYAIRYVAIYKNTK